MSSSFSLNYKSNIGNISIDNINGSDIDINQIKVIRQQPSSPNNRKKEINPSNQEDKCNSKDSIRKVLEFWSGNQLSLKILIDSLRNKDHILPFAGAGISAFVYPTWK